MNTGKFRSSIPKDALVKKQKLTAIVYPARYLHLPNTSTPHRHEQPHP
jgi:hypothetical protein